MTTLPLKFKEYLSDYVPVVIENGVVLAWGFKFKKHLGDELFTELRSLLPAAKDNFEGEWFVAVECLSAKGLQNSLGKKGEYKVKNKGTFVALVIDGYEFTTDWLKPNDEYGGKFKPCLVDKFKNKIFPAVEFS